MFRTFSVWALVCLFATLGIAQDFGSIRGQVLQENGDALSGAVINLNPTGREALSDAGGFFNLRSLPSGDYRVTISYPGLMSNEINVTVDGGVTKLSPITLKAPVSEEITVMGSLRDSQVKALNAQRLAANIKNIVAADQIGDFPDSNAAEATQRISGVNIVRDQGEGRYVQVRGTEARLNKNTVNGLTLPAPEGDLRTVALDVVPVSLLEAIEVSKAITPDMDGDAVGGSVNLITRTAPAQERFGIAVDYGYNELEEGDLGYGQFFWGRRFNDDRFGILASYSFEDTDRATDNFEIAYDDDEIEEFELRDYEVNRKRIGGLLSLDFRPNSKSHFVLNTSYAQFDDQEFRRRITNVLPDGEIERELKDRFETQSILGVQALGEYFTDNGGTVNVMLGYGYARESEPGRFDTTFKQEDVAFASSGGNFNFQPNPLNEDIGEAALDDIVREDNYTNDEHVIAEVNYSWPVILGEAASVFKVGAKLRTKDKTRDNNAFVFEGDDLFLSSFVDPGYVGESLFDGRYAMGRIPGSREARDLAALLGESERDHEEDTGDYEISEDLTAAYAMTTIDFSDNFMLLPGFRYERIDGDYTSFEVLFDEEGDWVETVPVTADKEDDLFMPMIHTRYRMDDGGQIRAALTRSYARARVVDQAPFRLINQEDSELERGNPDIDITKVWNLDLMYEKYFDETGLFSVGVFYKDLTDIIFIRNSDEIVNGEEFEVTQPLNGSDAELIGAELAFLKNWGNGFGVYFNFTYTDSEADFLDRTDFILPGQAEEMGNIALLFERNGFSARLALNHHGEYLEEVGGDTSEDIYFDEHSQWDFNASYSWDALKIVLEVVNLNDEEFVRYEGDASRPVQLEVYERWARLGVKYEF